MTGSFVSSSEFQEQHTHSSLPIVLAFCLAFLAKGIRLTLSLWVRDVGTLVRRNEPSLPLGFFLVLEPRADSRVSWVMDLLLPDWSRYVFDEVKACH